VGFLQSEKIGGVAPTDEYFFIKTNIASQFMRNISEDGDLAERLAESTPQSPLATAPLVVEPSYFLTKKIIAIFIQSGREVNF
jgi:hypothetical protein